MNNPVVVERELLVELRDVLASWRDENWDRWVARIDATIAQPAEAGGVEALRVRDMILMWNRRHESPPINEGYEYGVVDAVLAALAQPAKETGHGE